MNAVARMASDAVRAACVVIVMAVAASLVVETRLRLAAIDVAHRTAVQPGWAAQPIGAAPPPAADAPGPLRRLAIATLSWGDAALGVVR